MVCVTGWRWPSLRPHVPGRAEHAVTVAQALIWRYVAFALIFANSKRQGGGRSIGVTQKVLPAVVLCKPSVSGPVEAEPFFSL